MIMSRLKSILPGSQADPGRRRFRDTPVRNGASTRKADASPIRLVGYFVGGILLANLVLMASSAFRGRAAQAPAQFPAGISKHAPTAAAAEQSLLHIALAAEDDGDGDGDVDPKPGTGTPGESEPEHTTEAPKQLIANTCPEARERLISGLTLYYLQRSRRPYASTEEVLASVGAIVLLAGRSDPAVAFDGIPCAG